MRLSGIYALSLLTSVALSTGCDSETQPSQDNDQASDQTGTGTTATADDTGLTISGSYTGIDIPDDSKVAIIWMVSSSSPDYDYKLGEGTMVSGSFSVTLPQPLPAEAINSWGMGVGLVVALPADTVIPDGIMESNAYDDIIGASPRHTIIWREADIDTERAPWGSDFSEGFSCGSCLPSTSSFEGYEPTDCSDPFIMYDIDDESAPFCNWS